MSIFSNLLSTIISFIDEPNPPIIVPSSIVITFFVLVIDLIIVFSSIGLMNLTLITSQDICFFFNAFLISIALDTLFPTAIIDISSPSSNISAFPNDIFLFCVNLTSLSPPLGYLITTGDFNLIAYSIICSNSL